MDILFEYTVTKYFIYFKKLKYTAYYAYLVIENEYLPVVFLDGSPSSAYDPFMHGALSERVDPRSHPLTDVNH